VNAEEQRDLFLERVRIKLTVDSVAIRKCNKQGCTTGTFMTKEALIGFIFFDEIAVILFENEIKESDEDVIRCAAENVVTEPVFLTCGRLSLQKDGYLGFDDLKKKAEGNALLIGLIVSFYDDN